MLPLAHPSLHRYVNDAYHCDDLHTLYFWLEAHGYHYYGTFGAEQFGRFVCEELALGDVGPTEHTSVIEVALNRVKADSLLIIDHEDVRSLWDWDCFLLRHIG